MSTLDLKQVNLANLTNTAMTSLTCDDNGKVLMDGKEVVDLSEFGSSLATSGWQKLPSGLIIQWGQGTASNPVFYNTLPIAFPSEFYMVLAIHQGGQPSLIGEVTGQRDGLSGFDLFHSGSVGAVSCFWYAIGI